MTIDLAAGTVIVVTIATTVIVVNPDMVMITVIMPMVATALIIIDLSENGSCDGSVLVVTDLTAAGGAYSVTATEVDTWMHDQALRLTVRADLFIGFRSGGPL